MFGKWFIKTGLWMTSLLGVSPLPGESRQLMPDVIDETKTPQFTQGFHMIQSVDVRENGVIGKLFLPNVEEPRPAIVVFSGSDGGFYESLAQRFAMEGYVAFALAYFNVEGLPKNLENIPLEYFSHGIKWLQAQPQVISNKIHLYGPSRGGELVLLLASVFPDEIASVVAVVPSCVTNGGIPNEKEASWTLGGHPLPIAPSPSKEDVYKQLEIERTVNLSKIFLEKMEERLLFEAAFIKVENIRCPILLISGRDDKMWPSSLYADLIMKRLDTLKSPIFRDHLCYDNVGHMILCPYAPVITEAVLHPVTGVFLEVGGQADAQAAACKDSWEKILTFYTKWSKIASSKK